MVFKSLTYPDILLQEAIFVFKMIEFYISIQIECILLKSVFSSFSSKI